jgi:hypothetical protein
VVTISTQGRLTIMDRAAMNIDRAAIETARRAEAVRATAERIETLRHIMFRNATRDNSAIEGLTDETAAGRLLITASNQADGFLVLAIVREAIDRRWGNVVQAGIRYFDEHPVAQRIEELWHLTNAGRASA